MDGWYLLKENKWISLYVRRLLLVCCYCFSHSSRVSHSIRCWQWQWMLSTWLYFRDADESIRVCVVCVCAGVRPGQRYGVRQKLLSSALPILIIVICLFSFITIYCSRCRTALAASIGYWIGYTVHAHTLCPKQTARNVCVCVRVCARSVCVCPLSLITIIIIIFVPFRISIELSVYSHARPTHSIGHWIVPQARRSHGITNKMSR